MDVTRLRTPAELGQAAQVLAGGDRAALADRGDPVELRDDVLVVLPDLTEAAFGLLVPPLPLAEEAEVPLGGLVPGPGRKAVPVLGVSEVAALLMQDSEDVAAPS
ncbi:hypothetical protein J7E88_32895 [Streptomyces sp. ISL-10]|uniref:hypothetical protein n=1 Tax=Streptomyces sp. ISL-10 TaxID=2819172 RepID=UPI001BE5D9D9|nr:hypothetical protein [Streptomyces sp. ISL-10]MBT2369940.1 hypothetical protein [Streptomyces sp. ISL-10]